MSRLAVIGAAVLVVWGLCFRFVDGAVFKLALDLHAAEVGIATAASSDPMHDYTVISYYPWVLAVAALFLVAMMLAPIALTWRRWSEVAERPAPEAAVACGAWGVFAAVELMTRPWALTGHAVATAAGAAAAAGLVLGAWGTWRLFALERRQGPEG